MNDNLKRIQDCLRIGQYSSNPKDCAEDLAILAGEYSFVCGHLEDVLKAKPSIWNATRLQTQSDKSADKAWDAIEQGINEMGLRLRMKSIEKMMSALKSLIAVAEGQARNQY